MVIEALHRPRVVDELTDADQDAGQDHPRPDEYGQTDRFEGGASPVTKTTVSVTGFRHSLLPPGVMRLADAFSGHSDRPGPEGRRR